MKSNQLFLTILALAISGSAFASTPFVYKYRIYCNTEAQNVYEWATTEPTTCPNNTAHSINLNSISIVDQQGPSIFTVKEETTPTGGNFRTESKTINASAGPNVTTTLEFSWPFDINVLAIYMVPTTTHEGDLLTIAIGENTPVGVITADVAAGATTIPVNSTALSYLSKGFYVTVTDGTNADELGRVISFDAVGSTITVETATVHAFAAATPTYVEMTVVPVDQLELVAGLQYTVGIKKIGGSFLPANTVVTATYVNNTNVAKSLVFSYEYLY